MTKEKCTDWDSVGRPEEDLDEMFRSVPEGVPKIRAVQIAPWELGIAALGSDGAVYLLAKGETPAWFKMPPLEDAKDILELFEEE